MDSHFHPPVILAVTYDAQCAWTREGDGKNHGEIDAALCAMQMMLQAAELGLARRMSACSARKAACVLPGDGGCTPIALLTLGHPAEGAHPARLHTQRKPLEDLVQYL